MRALEFQRKCHRATERETLQIENPTQNPICIAKPAEPCHTIVVLVALPTATCGNKIKMVPNYLNRKGELV